MRKVAAAVLAVPVLAVLYLPVLARRSVAARVMLLTGVGLLIGLGALGLSRPAATSATPPSPPITALTADAFRSIAAATDLRAEVRITFSEPMDAASVAAALTVSPTTPVSLAWDATGTTLRISPKTHWQAGTYHTISVAPGALARTGRPMSSTARAAFVTRPATTARIVATDVSADRASIATGFRISFDRLVDATRLAAALRIAPVVDGSLDAVAGRPDSAPAQAQTFVFKPATTLAAGTTYTVSLDGLVDADGAAVAGAPSLTTVTSAAPRIVRFRPVSGTKDVARAATISVRFSEAMSHATTKAAIVVTADGKPVAGKITFAEHDTVVVFKPTAALPYGALVVVRVDATATTKRGVPLGSGAQVSIQIVARPRAAVRVKAPAPRPSGGSSGGSVGGGSWGAVETYYLKLMNCTRTGGWVTSTGACSSPGGRNVAPLRLDAGISSKVSRPYAKKLAVNNLCTHFSGGNPGDRLRAAGYTSYRWAENLGCRSGNPYSAVLGSHLFFQSEKSYSGGHYVNLMNAAYDRVGIGVWVSGGRVRLVIDFYHPL